MNEKELTNIAIKLKTKREELGISLESLANKTKLSKSTLQRYETGGIANVPLDKLEILSTALELSINEFLGIPTSTEINQEEKEYLANFKRLNISTKNNILHITEDFKILNEENQNKVVERSRELVEIQSFREKVEQKENKIIPFKQPEQPKEKVKIIARGEGITYIDKDEFDEIMKNAIIPTDEELNDFFN